MRHQRFTPLIVLLAVATAAAAFAEGTEEDGPTAQPTVESALKSITQRYGIAAVSLQGFLLAHAISAGAQLEVTVSITGMESHDGREYLAYLVDTGIAYQAAEVTRREQLSRLWSDIVEPTLRKATVSQLPGAGLALRLKSYRGQFADRAAIVRELAGHRMQSVATTFILPSNAIRDFLDGKITAHDMSTRGIVEVDGSATQLELIPTPIPTPEL